MTDNISLNGKWAIIFDQDNRGGVEKWHLNRVFEKHKEVSDIQIPSHWETINKDFEGVVLQAYECSAGYTSIGIGRNLDTRGITEDEAMYLLNNDIEYFLIK